MSEKIAAKVKKTSARGEANSDAEFAFGTLDEELAPAEVLDELEPEPVFSLLAVILNQFLRDTGLLTCLACAAGGASSGVAGAGCGA